VLGLKLQKHPVYQSFEIHILESFGPHQRTHDEGAIDYLKRSFKIHLGIDLAFFLPPSVNYRNRAVFSTIKNFPQ
jgi:hypothetical protein